MNKVRVRASDAAGWLWGLRGAALPLSPPHKHAHTMHSKCEGEQE